MKGRYLAFAGALAIVVAAGMSPRSAGAGSPGTVSVTANGAPQTYGGTVGPGWPDPNGPPAPIATCSNNSAGTVPCDRETVTYHAGSAPLTDLFALAVTFTYTPSDQTAQNCLDVAIEDSSASTVFAHQACVPTGTTITDPNLDPSHQYTIEVDANGSAAVGVGMQPFSASVAATAAPAPVIPPTPVPTKPFSFTHEVSVDVQRGDGEPDLAISNDNKSLYTSTPYGFSTTVSLLYKSSDGGVTWKSLHGSAVGDTPPCPIPTAVSLRPDCSRGGGDSEIQLSAPMASSTQQTVQFEDLNGLDSISCAYSTDGGDTFHDLTAFTISGNPVPGTACDEGGTVPATCQTFPPPTGTCGSLGTDRQWVQVWPKADQPSGTSDILYMTFDTGDQPPNGDAAIYSTDNGQHWTAACTTTTGSSCVGGPSGVGSRPGPMVINPTLVNTVTGVAGVVSGSYPTLYEFMGTSSNGSEVNISCDGGQTWSHIATSNGQAGGTTNDFVAGAMDSTGELYTAYTVSNSPNPWRVWFAHSTDTAGTTKVGDCSVPVQGDKWSTPAPLTGGPSAADAVTTTPIPSENYAVMPWIVAGSAGRVDLAYYGTTSPIGLSPDSGAATWFMHMAQTLDGGGTWTDETATETPMHVKSICFSGILCSAMTPPGGDRNLLDFFEVKLDSTGRAVIIYADDNNTAACASTCSPGIGLVSEVQQAGGPSLFGTGNVPALTNGLQTQSINGDVRQAGVNADVADPTSAADAVLATTGHNIQGTNVPALDITDLKVCTTASVACPVTNTHGNTLSFLFTLSSLSGGLSSAVAGNHTGALWLVTWRWNNDLWFAQASFSSSGGMTCLAGRPLSVYNDGEPKAVEYINNPETTPLAGSACTTTGNRIEIDVPESNVGGVGTTSDTTTNHVLYGLTGWTGDQAATLPVTVCAADGVNPTTDTCTSSAGQSNTSVGFFDNADETAPLDVSVATPSPATPESPAVPLIVGLGLLAGAGVVYVRGRRQARALGV